MGRVCRRLLFVSPNLVNTSSDHSTLLYRHRMHRVNTAYIQPASSHSNTVSHHAAARASMSCSSEEQEERRLCAYIDVCVMDRM